jgi:uncharacterized membrane protein YhiD involved in acid resistance
MPKVKDKRIEEIAEEGVKKYVEKNVLKRALYFLKEHGLSINAILLICIIVVMIWYGRPLYDKFNKMPNKIEAVTVKNLKQDSMDLVLIKKIERIDKMNERKFSEVNKNLNLLIDYRDANKKLLKELINKNTQAIMYNSNRIDSINKKDSAR